MNGDDQNDLSDAIVLLGYLFLGGAAPPCLEAGDLDDNGALDITDPIALLAYLFQGGAAPPEPFAACGVDPTPDGIGCEGGTCH